MTAVATTGVATTQRRLKITEIFRSIQGESTLAGLPTTFVRLTGCPLRCGYCDTEYAFHGGAYQDIDAVVAETGRLATQHVCVTGGEPLAQRAAPALLTALCDAGHVVSLETSGALPIAGLDARVIVVMDVKTPSSGESHRNLDDNPAQLKAGDQVKFVIGERGDFEFARDWLDQHRLVDGVHVLWSPEYPRMAPAELAQWLIDSGVTGRLQLQLHKLIWGEVPGR